MSELREAANNWQETKDLLNDEDTKESTREHSYLPNYFIGSDRWTGLKINKRKYFDLTKEENLNTLYIAAAEGRFFCPIEKAESTETKAKEAVINESLNISYIDYSPKAFAIIGETKAIKDQLKNLGGRFNFRLTCGAGWIFSKAKESEILKALNISKDVATS